MAKAREIELTIDENGIIAAEAVGYKGQGCSEDIKTLLDGAGKTVDVKKKTEWYDKQKLHINRQ